MTLDPLSRLLRITTADGACSETRYAAWHEEHRDANGNVSVHHCDALGRMRRIVQPLRTPGPAGLGEPRQIVTCLDLDIQGQLRFAIDPRGMAAQGLAGPHCAQFEHDMRGLRLVDTHVDAGTCLTLPNALGDPLHTWDQGGPRITLKHDLLRRPVELWLGALDAAGQPCEKLIERMQYGDQDTAARERNQCGRMVAQYDAAGVLRYANYAPFGGATLITRQLCADALPPPDWSAQPPPRLDGHVFATQIASDALGRVVREQHADGSTLVRSYHPEGWLHEVSLRRDGAPPLRVARFEHNERGQRTHLHHGNGVSCVADWDPTTHRLAGITSTRHRDRAVLQHLRYAYDPAGNVTRIDDHTLTCLAALAVFKPGLAAGVDSTSTARDFRYDTLARLCSATGRMQGPQGIEPYALRFDYDSAGNRIEVDESRGHRLWQALQIDCDSNRVLALADRHGKQPLQHDVHGNLRELAGVGALRWDHRHQLASVGQREHYVYSSAGHRVRKLSQATEPGARSETVYLGSLNVQRRWPVSTREVPEVQSWSLSVEGEGRLAVQHTANGQSEWRYLLMDQLGSVGLELDADGEVTRYTEYFPFGEIALRLEPAPTAAHAAGHARPYATPYGYSGKELDPASGLLYYGARYLSPALGRWINPDPAGTVDGLNLYRFVQDNPVTFDDPQGMMLPSLKRATPAPAAKLHAPLPAGVGSVGANRGRNASVFLHSSGPGAYMIGGHKLMNSSLETEAQAGVSPGLVSKAINHLRDSKSRAGIEQLSEATKAREEHRAEHLPGWKKNAGRIEKAEFVSQAAGVAGTLLAAVPFADTATSAVAAAADATNLHLQRKAETMLVQHMAQHGRNPDDIVHHAKTVVRKEELKEALVDAAVGVVPLLGSVKSAYQAVSSATGSPPSKLNSSTAQLNSLSTMRLLEIKNPSPLSPLTVKRIFK